MYAHDKAVIPPLERATIVAVAVALMNETGLDALTTRRLAERLGVRGPALYWHIGSMEELRGYMCEAVLESSSDRVMPSSDWRQWLVDNVVEARAALLALKDGGRLIAQSRWTERTMTTLMERYVRPLVGAGVRRDRALQIVAAVNSYCMGWVVMEERADRRTFMANKFDADALFAEGATALVNGLAP